MARPAELGRWLRKTRREKGFSSAAALARAARLPSVNHVAILERGEYRPRWKTAERLMKALRLTPEEREEFTRLWTVAGTPEAAQAVTRALELPQVIRWRHLPAHLFDLPHSTPPAAYCDPDRVLEEVVSALDPLLCWVAVASGQAPLLDAVRAAVQAARVESDASKPSFVYTGMPAAWRELARVQRAIPHCVRAHLFGSATATAGILKTLSGWAYLPRAGAHPADAVFVRLTASALDERYGVHGIAAAEIAGVHRMLLLAHYWAQLGLEAELGPPTADSDIVLQVQGYSAVRTLLKLTADDALRQLYPDGLDRPASGQAYDELAFQVRHARFRTRLFDAPALALDTLGLLSAEDRADVLRKCDELSAPLARAAREFGVDQTDPLAQLPAPTRRRRHRSSAARP